MITISTYTSGDWNNTTWVSNTPGTPYYISAPSGITVSGINVTDCHNSGYDIDASLRYVDNVDGGNTVGWLWPTYSGASYDQVRTFVDFNAKNHNAALGVAFQQTKEILEFVAGNNLYNQGVSYNHVRKLFEFVSIPTTNTAFKLSYLSLINNALIDAINAMSVAGGYFYNTGTVQQEDLSKVDAWPLYNVYLDPDEISLDERTFPSMNSMRNLSRWNIRCYNRLSEGGNNKFDGTFILYRMLDDIKKMTRDNYTLGGIVEGVQYRSARRINAGNGSDIICPEYLIITLDIPYSQSTQDFSVAGCV